MKHYLVLENGTTLNLKHGGFHHNVLGVVSVENQMLSLDDPSTGKHYQTALDVSEASLLNSLILSNDSLLAKFVTDELPLDYHLYDLKTVLFS